MSQEAEDGIVVLPSAPRVFRNGDVEHPYRQDSNFFYLTGFEEPESLCVIDVRERKASLFLQPRDSERELWDGPRIGLEGALECYRFEQAFPSSVIRVELPKLLQSHSVVYYDLGVFPTWDALVLDSLRELRERRGTERPTRIVELSLYLHEMRLLKGDVELLAMREAASITAEAHMRVMRFARPGLCEYEIETMLLDTFRRRGAAREAYPSIVAAGSNATTLHHRAGVRRLQDGELLLVDAGCEYDYYASDVTRTFPANGIFFPEQKEIYELVYHAQLASLQSVRVGTTLEEIHQRSVEVITHGLVELGLLTGNAQELIENGGYKQFFPHRTSHWLGMDVHDVGAYLVKGAPRVLAPGMVFTVEPGIYISANCTRVEDKWRGIGVRLEDNIIVTQDGFLNLTSELPKTVQEVEGACRENSRDIG
ncbi:hypothetical protein BCY86_06570 [Pajaroellobacter abortibovis]|uniref:Xaa-Pro aminopeptidase n=1 Tax=Pajaroellobacter abortibovis TaxID=1882918 RepID=A0A1L6MZG6_9BACT|nr:hypothetical protein BCY86_06570 [Pajaroellobacter abortibovis]